MWITQAHSLASDQQSLTGTICNPNTQLPLTQTFLIFNLVVLHWGPLLPSLLLNIWCVLLSAPVACNFFFQSYRQQLSIAYSCVQVVGSCLRALRERPSPQMSTAADVDDFEGEHVHSYHVGFILSALADAALDRVSPLLRLPLAVVRNLNLASNFWLIINHVCRFNFFTFTFNFFLSHTLT